MPIDDKRLIEDYLPIEAISAEASREKSVRKGHISTLHLWWARRPLVACRTAVYGALVPASQFAPNGASDAKKKSLGRANAAKFMQRLCQYPSDSKPEQKADIGRAIKEAQGHILHAHAGRLTEELRSRRRQEADSLRSSNDRLLTPAATGSPSDWIAEFNFKGDSVTVDDIIAGRAPRPRVLDMFAGGGAIPLEALRLGCEAYALDLNPVAHIIQLCTLVYPQKYGRPDPNARGMTGPKNAKGETTWGGLAEEVRYWGEWVLRKVRIEIGDLYPLIPDPDFKGKRPEIEFDRSTGEWVLKRTGKRAKGVMAPQETMEFAGDPELDLSGESQSSNTNRKSEPPPGYLMPVAYLWTRTVKCKNPACGATVPLVKQTWLCKKEGRYVAMKVIAPRGKKDVRFDVVEARSEKGLGFDPEAFSKGGNAACPFCGTVADSDYVKGEGSAGRMDQQLMAIVCTRPARSGKVYLAADSVLGFVPEHHSAKLRIERLCSNTGLTTPDEPIVTDAKNCCWILLYGQTAFSDLFLPRQLLCLLTFSAALREKPNEAIGIDEGRWDAIVSSLACWVDRLADFNSKMCTLKPGGERGVVHSFTRPGIPLVWDYAEANPLGTDSANARDMLDYLGAALEAALASTRAAEVYRGSATAIPLPDAFMDVVITDPPYYDNVPYAVVSDFFFVWLKRSLGLRHQEHFAGQGTPKKQEAVADATRHGGSDEKARQSYERMMFQSFSEAHRVLKSDGEFVIVYAHKTTLGWSTLVDALRLAGFMVTEAWPLDTEMKSRLRGIDSAALATSIFLVALKRPGLESGNYEEQVRAELEQIVRERVETLWDMGVSGADLVIACVGAGLRAFTQFARVEYANGQEVPAERFLAEVETVVLETILARLSKEVGGRGGLPAPQPSRQAGQTSLAGLDAATRFYVLWRYTYKNADLDAGEAIIFANGTHVELDGPDGLSSGANAILVKNKARYRLRDFTERGGGDDLGLPRKDGASPPTIDALHRLLWLLEFKPPRIPEFLADAGVSAEQLRLVAQALAGPALKGGELADVSPGAEQSALGKLLANWNTAIEGKAATADRRTGQTRLL